MSVLHARASRVGPVVAVKKVAQIQSRARGSGSTKSTAMAKMEVEATIAKANKVFDQMAALKSETEQMHARMQNLEDEICRVKTFEELRLLAKTVRQ